MGANLCRPHCGEDEALVGLVAGAAIGETLMLPVGVHLGNQRAGAFGLDLLASAAVAGASVALTAGSENGVFLFLGVIAQVATATWIERKVGGVRTRSNLVIAIQSASAGDIRLRASIAL